MARDPALLVYTQDILIGAAEMTHEEFGQYCRILFYMHQKGRLSEETIRLLVGSPFDKVRAKFSVDKRGQLFSDKLEEVIATRQKWVESRRMNGSKGGRPKRRETICLTENKPTEDEDKDEIEIENENKSNEAGAFETAWAAYPNHQGKKAAKRHFEETVKTAQDFGDLQKALNNYLNSKRVKNGYVQNGSTWFNDWQSWVKPTPQMMGDNENERTGKVQSKLSDDFFERIQRDGFVKRKPRSG